MSNAVLYLHPGGYDTSSPQLLGRVSAGESFLRGYLRHAAVDRYHFWNIANRPQKDLEAMLARIGEVQKPVQWIGRNQRVSLGQVGVLNMPVPALTQEAWHRRRIGARAYAICGITHTTATDRVMQSIADMLVSPTEDYDALICTSAAVRRSIDVQLGMMREHLTAEFGPRRRPEPMRVTIPLGINTDDFQTSAERRKAWRERLDIPEDAVVALFMGRFNVRGKMNPALMALSLERAAKRAGKPLYWVNAGWSPSEKDDETYHARTRALCPSVEYRNVDGRPPDVRFSIWSVADFFISFSDNIQETFGLTPVEAMAAGLPCVVTDWDGYKDTVRQGVDGFRVATVAPAPGYGTDLAYWYDNQWLSYDDYVGAAAQFTAIDYAAAEAAIVALIENPDLRRTMGESARIRAREVFDWAAIIPQYQALWAEQNHRRLAAGPAQGSHANPYRPDPFALFDSYPTRHLTWNDTVTLSAPIAWEAAEALLKNPLVHYSMFNQITHEEVRQVLEHLAGRPGAPVRELAELFPQPRRNFVARGLLWLARYGLIVIAPPAPPTA